MNEFINPAPVEIRTILSQAKTLAVIGLSPKEARPSNRVAKAMQGFGYKIIPVRPGVKQVLGEPAFRELADVDQQVDIVDVFRAPEHVMPIVDQAIEQGIKVLWLQEGVINLDAARKAQQHGITVIMDRCIYKDYQKLLGN